MLIEDWLIGFIIMYDKSLMLSLENSELCLSLSDKFPFDFSLSIQVSLWKDKR